MQNLELCNGKVTITMCRLLVSYCNCTQAYTMPQPLFKNSLALPSNACSQSHQELIIYIGRESISNAVLPCQKALCYNVMQYLA